MRSDWSDGVPPNPGGRKHHANKDSDLAHPPDGNGVPTHPPATADDDQDGGPGSTEAAPPPVDRARHQGSSQWATPWPNDPGRRRIRALRVPGNASAERSKQPDRPDRQVAKRRTAPLSERIHRPFRDQFPAATLWRSGNPADKGATTRGVANPVDAKSGDHQLQSRVPRIQLMPVCRSRTNAPG